MEESTEEDSARDWERNSICCRLSSICTEPRTVDYLNRLVEQRTRIGFEVAKFLTAFVLYTLEQPHREREPMWPFDQDIVDRAWMILSTEDGEVFTHKDAAPRRKQAAPKRSAATTAKLQRSKTEKIAEKEEKLVKRCERAATKSHREEIARGTKRKREPSSVDDQEACAKRRYDEILQEKIAQERVKIDTRRKKALERKELQRAEREKARGQRESEEEERERERLASKARTQVIKREMYEFFLTVWRPLRGEKYVIPDRAGLNRVRQMARKEYLTSAKNNVALNFEKRTLKWIRHRIRQHLYEVTGDSNLGKDEASLVYSTARAVYWRSWSCDLDEPDRKVPDYPADLKKWEHAEKLAIATALEEEIIRFRRGRFVPPATERNLGSNFHWFLFLPWMKVVARDFEAWIEQYENKQDDDAGVSIRGIKQFPILPQPDMKHRFICMTKDGLNTLASKLKIPPESILNPASFPPHANCSQFSGTWRTDGVAAILIFQRNKKKKKKKEKESHQKDSSLLDPKDRRRVIGIDPGRKTLAACYDGERFLDVSNSEYHHLRRSKQRAARTNILLERSGLKVINDNMPSARTGSYARFMVNAEYCLRHVHDLQTFFLSAERKEARFNGYRLKYRALDRIARMITRNQPCIIGFGAATFNCASAGQQVTPNRALRKRLTRQPNSVVLDIDECNTSQRCPLEACGNCCGNRCGNGCGTGQLEDVYQCVELRPRKAAGKKPRERESKLEAKHPPFIRVQRSKEEVKRYKEDLRVKEAVADAKRWLLMKRVKTKVEQKQVKNYDQTNNMRRRIKQAEYDKRKAQEGISKKALHRLESGQDGKWMGVRVNRELLWSVKHCKCCGHYFNRDHAAAINIRSLTLSELRGEPRPSRFSKTP